MRRSKPARGALDSHALEPGGRVAVEGVGVVDGEDEGGELAEAGEEPGVDQREGEPLEVDDVGGGRR